MKANRRTDSDWIIPAVRRHFARAMNALRFIPLIVILAGCHSTDAHRRTMLTAGQARLIARQLANDQARTLYDLEPFWNGAPARFVQGGWIWSDRQGCGVGDVEATVILAADGSPRSIDVMFLDTQGGNW